MIASSWSPRRPVSLLAAMVLATTCWTAAWGENWPRFRGENGSGVSGQKGLPVEWSPGDYVWNIELPGVGHASPTIWGDHLFITSALGTGQEGGETRYLFCLDPETGQEKWSRVVGLSSSHRHQKSSWASSTPTTDGERVYVIFADRDNHTVTAYDFEGDLVWRRNLGSYESQHGQGASPILFEDLLIVPNDQRGPSSIVALDRRTGETEWSTLRDAREASYSTPILIERPGEDPQLICCSGAMGVTSLDPSTGRHNWITGPLPMRTVASPVYGDGLVFMSCGQGGRGGVLQIGVDTALVVDGSAGRIRYERTRMLPYVPTPVAYEGHLYFVTDDGVGCCVEFATGETVWTRRLGGNFSSSLVCVDGKIYAVNEAGDVFVFRASPDYELLGTTSLGDPSHATPAVANGMLFLRTFHRLAALKSVDAPP